MGLRIVYGRAGSGKTSFCMNDIRNSLDMGGTHPLILIVPEQFSLQAEKNLARASGSSGVFRAEVLSFRRLAFRVFSEVGGISRHHLNAAGKSMMLFRILNGMGSELKVFSRSALRKGFTETLSETITEFKRYDIAPEKLERAAAGLEDGLPLKDKLGDLARVYSEFERLLHERYMDADDDLVELYKKLDRSVQYDGAEIWIDEFSGFTPQEYKVIAKLAKKAKRITISLCTDCLSNDPGDGAPLVFTPVRNTAVRLARLAAEEGVEVEKPVALRPSARFAFSPELGHLEQNFYKYPGRKYPGLAGDITISASANMYSEAEDVAGDVIRLCREMGYRYRDIAVTMRNPDSYSSIVRTVFTRFGIPFFFDGKRMIEGHPLVVFILSALDVFTESWSYEAVFRYARTGLTGVAREELDLLENYVLANGIRGNIWIRPEDWDYPVDRSGKPEEPSSKDLDTLARINAARRHLTGPLEAFRARTKGGAKAVEFCTGLYELLCTTGVDKAVESLSKRFLEEGRLDKAEEYRQVWNIAMDVFSQVVEVLGEEELGTERFSEVLAAGFAGHRISLIPPALDQVLVGSMERARSHDIKALYILGANEGVLPGTTADDGLISDVDRDRLGEMGLELAGDTASKCMEERFMIYMALATPSRYLWLSYPAADREGRALRPSRILPEIRRILPGTVEKSTVAGGNPADIPIPSAPEPVFDEMVARLRVRYDGEEIPDGWKEIFGWFSRNPAWKDKCGSIIGGLDYTNQVRGLSAEKTAELYGKPMLSSVSRMESYSSCPFSFYVRYGLKAKERAIFRFDPVDAGTFLHQCIDEFSRMLVRKGVSWRELDRDWCSEQVSMLVDEQLEKNSGRVLGSSKRYVWMSGRLKRTLTKAILMIGRHIGTSSFDPSGYEVEFGDKGRYPPIAVELPSGECIRLTGRIDRVDSMKNEDGTWLRIIDYKSGDRSLRLSDVYYGLQLQLVTYLDAVLGTGEGAAGCAEPEREQDRDAAYLPAGILYFRLDDPLIRCGRDSSDEEIERAVSKQLRMKGLVLSDAKIVREMDRQIDGDSLIIPARINRDGALGRSSAATLEQFGVLCGFVRKTLSDIGGAILEGDAAIRPYKKKTMTACSYCSFRPVCQFDTSIRDNRYRLLSDLKEDELWKLMRGATEGGQTENAGGRRNNPKTGQGGAD